MAPKSDEQFKDIRNKRYEEISNAALKVFARKGFAASKISDITSTADLSHGLFYHYFDSKKDIYVSIIMNVLDLFIETVETAESQKGTPWEQIVWLTKKTYSASLEQELDRHILIIQAFQSESLPDKQKKAMIQKYTTAMEGISRIITRGQRDGLFIEGDPMELAIYYQSLNHGLTLWNAKGFYPIDVSVEKVMRQLQA
ncbi:TetR/AcrR family transcriptional regulator [Lentibacillus amyloliquefaciens]|uniref:HTH tetR-type domain-containing protein n=1 Tax=Lentibacillus amyloliquefaciens TaxID=1472767 RepID=A0A0U3NS70_9BACI|nr:TetR/AcrR family transcriptional regulator [Lentibacillus amyloliquefaciens]ALX49483.1 hypothetical protein AOX59_13445 [Lentibacillus amyloliquefaciens]